MKDTNATVIVDLNQTEEEILKNLHKDARWGIGRAKKENLNVEISNNKKDWEEFYEIYKNTISKGGANIETLEHVKEHGQIFFTCKKNGKLVAGATLEIIKGQPPRLSRNASLNEYQKMQPNNLLYWECIKWSKSNGYKRLDLGGYQINPIGHIKGVNKFKEKWGRIVYYYKDYPIHIAIGRKLFRKSKLARIIKNKIRG